MTSVPELVRLRRLLKPAESETASAAAAERLALGRNPHELAAIAAQLRRGTSWEELSAWIVSARGDLAEPAYHRALELFTDSALLTWSECAGVANALIYRGWPPAGARRERRPERVVDLVSVEAHP